VKKIEAPIPWVSSPAARLRRYSRTSFLRRARDGQLDGKVAIVTGAARGLGRAICAASRRARAKLAVADLNLRSYQEFEARRRT